MSRRDVGIPLGHARRRVPEQVPDGTQLNAAHPQACSESVPEVLAAKRADELATNGIDRADSSAGANLLRRLRHDRLAISKARSDENLQGKRGRRSRYLRSNGRATVLVMAAEATRRADSRRAQCPTVVRRLAKLGSCPPRRSGWSIPLPHSDLP